MEEKEHYTMEDLLQIMRKLRAQDGCPWDKVQTHDSIKYCAVEEAWEVVDAINGQDDNQLKNELGDLLMQVVFHAQIGAEDNTFTFDDVLYEICHKLITRHSHVFGNDSADNPSEVSDLWDQRKKEEKHLTSYTDSLVDVPRSFPALMRAQKVSKRAAKANFDWPTAEGAIAKVEEELQELKEAMAEGNIVHQDEELGDLLFAVTNAARWLSLDSEMSLQKATEKFINRFSQMEQLAELRGQKFDELSLSQQEELWQEIKRQFRS